MQWEHARINDQVTLSAARHTSYQQQHTHTQSQQKRESSDVTQHKHMNNALHSCTTGRSDTCYLVLQSTTHTPSQLTAVVRDHVMLDASMHAVRQNAGPVLTG
jgi:hypothetical protein